MPSGEKPSFPGWSVGDELEGLSLAPAWSCSAEDDPDRTGVLRRVVPPGSAITRAKRSQNLQRLEELDPPEVDSVSKSSSKKKSAKAAEEQEAPPLARLLSREGFQDGLIVEESVAGITLAEYLEEAELTGPVPARNLQIARSLLSACHALCDAAIEHGNLHPGNVIITEGDRVRVVGFSWPTMEPVNPQSESNRREWLQLLTYCAPEYFDEHSGDKGLGYPGQVPGQWDDYWAIGVMLYELLEGSSPYNLPGGNWAQQWKALLKQMKERANLTSSREGPDPDPDAEINQLLRAVQEQMVQFTAVVPEARFLMRQYTASGKSLDPSAPSSPPPLPELVEEGEGEGAEGGEPAGAEGVAEGADSAASAAKAKAEAKKKAKAKAKAKRRRSVKSRLKRAVPVIASVAAIAAIVAGAVAISTSQTGVGMGFGPLAGQGLGISTGAAATAGSVVGTASAGANGLSGASGLSGSGAAGLGGAGSGAAGLGGAGSGAAGLGGAGSAGLEGAGAAGLQGAGSAGLQGAGSGAQGGASGLQSRPPDGGAELDPCPAAGSRAVRVGGEVAALANQACYCDSNDQPAATPETPDVGIQVFIRKGIYDDGSAYELTDRNAKGFCSGLAPDSDWRDMDLRVSASVLSACICACGYPVNGNVACRKNNIPINEWTAAHAGYRYNLWRGELAAPDDTYPMDEPLVRAELQCKCPLRPN